MFRIHSHLGKKVYRETVHIFGQKCRQGQTVLTVRHCIVTPTWTANWRYLVPASIRCVILSIGPKLSSKDWQGSFDENPKRNKHN